MLAWPAAAEQPSEAAQLDAARAALDRIDSSLKREGLSVQALFELGAEPQSRARRALDAKIADLEPRLRPGRWQLKQLGPVPAQGAPPESAALAAERARLNGEFSELDADLEAGAAAGRARR